MTVTRGAHFTPDFLGFLRELARHNNRDWFNANKERYEGSVRDPFLRFVADLQPLLKKISPHFVADPSPVGGSMMRIYRDTRFSKDKTPYKTAVTAHFWHSKGKEGATPAFYLRLQPSDASVGAGIWHPEPGALRKIRKAIVDDSNTWERVKDERTFRSSCRMAGESLKRPPPGFDAKHPFIEDIKRKDFATSAPLDDGRVASATFMDDVLEAFRMSSPFLAFVTKAVGLSF
jgi:uncharacterized protein (TIGR02453 family)